MTANSLKTRVALCVKRPGAEDVFLDVDLGTDSTTLELALGQLYGSIDPRAERLWMAIDGAMIAIVPENPREHEPLGNLLAAGELHSVVLSAEQPPVRGTQ